MFDLDKWQEILATLRKNKLRAFLTACGVFWGIFMLLVMLGFGTGLRDWVHKDMGGFATNSVFFWGRVTTVPYRGMRPGRRIVFRNDDIKAIRSRVAGIQHLVPENQLGGWQSGNNVTRGIKTGNFTVMGDYPADRYVDTMVMESGRFVNHLDITRGRKVAVIGKTVYEQLYKRGEKALGTYIRINGVYFQVVGVFRSQQSGEQADRENTKIFIPFTSFQQAFNYGDHVGFIGITAKPSVDVTKVEKQVKTILRAAHKVSPADQRAIGSWNASKEFGNMTSLFGGIRLLIWFVGTMTLLAGVIGVSNIMLIVVKERTKEIGVRKALGATPASIVSLVIQESVVLTAIAGYAGIVCGVGLIQLIDMLVAKGGGHMFKPEVDFRVTVIATAILIVSGALAGLIPARMAARINPVEALRSE